MKKNQNALAKEKGFVHLRRLAWVALVCTAILLLSLWIGSLLPAGTSRKITLWIQSLIRGVNPEADINNGEASGFLVDLSLIEGEDYYTGSIIKVTATAQPEGTHLGDVNITAKNDEIAKTEGNTLILGKYGTTTVTITAKDNPLLKQKITINSLGQDPKTVEELDVGENQITLMQGESAQIVLNNGFLDPRFTEIEFSLPEKLELNGDTLFAKEEGEIIITYTLGDLSANQTVKILPVTDIEVPVSLNPKNDLSFVVGEDILIENLIYDDSVLSESCHMEIIDTDADLVYIYPSESKALALKEGTAQIRVISNFDESIFVDVFFEIVPQKATAFILKGDSFISFYENEYYYTLQTEWGDQISSDDITWSVKGNATVSPEGKLTPTGLGKIWLSATVVRDGLSYTANKEISVRLYSDFYGFVRKIAGHFSLFALLGLGLGAVCLLTTKPKWLSPLYAAATGTVAAGISEMFQLPIFSSGRYATTIDFFVDFMGVCLGIAVFWIIAAIIFLFDYFLSGGNYMRIIRKMSFASLKPIGKQANATNRNSTENDRKATLKADKTQRAQSRETIKEDTPSCDFKPEKEDKNSDNSSA